jgi:hypothetical protein
MDNKSPYNESHLFVAAIRILEHKNGSPPALAQIADLLRISQEQGGLISRRLKDMGIIAPVEGAFDDRWVVTDHLKLEEIPKEVESSELDDALKKFQAERNKIAQKVESIKEEQARKKKELFAGLEKKLKKELPKE